MTTKNPTRGLIHFRTDDATAEPAYAVAQQGQHQANLGAVEPREVSIRPIPVDSPDHTLDDVGFALLERPSDFERFDDDDAIERAYYPEVAEVIREATGAAFVHVFDHNVRFASEEKRRERGARGPVLFAHNDYTEQSAPQRIEDLLGDQAEALPKGRWAFVNLWRPLRGPVVDSPLALADARTVEPQDLVEIELRYGDRSGEVYAIKYNENHEWWYAPEMQPDQALLIKCYDSSEEQAPFTAHTAFQPIGVDPNRSTRESIEVRTIVFFGDEEVQAEAA